MIGTTVSHYKILEKIGGGGMGIVYKAQDLKLDRTVALKFLPPELTLDPDAKERFVHEAKAASSLQHHNICTIHDIDEAADGQMFIVMDLYEGETLKSRIAKGRLRIEEATDIAIQIAQGLAEAHEHGIVHRDVKPANVLITKGGIAKIVDFGLAKLSGATKVTKTGSTLGTVAYMAPEQLQGSDVDARADIFSVGVVLYEMLTGKTPFRGDHEAALMYSIMNEEPEPLQTHIPDVTSELIHVVSRALEKDPASRYKTMDDLLIDLRRVRKETSKVSLPAFGGKRLGFFTRRRIVVFSSAIVLAGIAIALFLLNQPRKLPRLNPAAILHPLQLPVRHMQYGCLSPDGNWIAFGGADQHGTWDVYFMNSSGGEVRRVTHDSSSFAIVGQISRDGALILYSRERLGKGEIALVPTLGGSSQFVCAGAVPRFAAFGDRIFYHKGWPVAPSESGESEVWSVKLDGTDDHIVFKDPGFSEPRQAATTIGYSPSPDGRKIAWIKTDRDFSANIITYDLVTHAETQVTFSKGIMDEVFWTRNNFIIYSLYTRSSGNFDLWMCAPDGGESLQLTRSSTADEVAGTLSEDGRKLLYYQVQLSGYVQILSLETGEYTRVTSDDRNKSGVCLSPDNRYVAYTPAASYDNFKTLWGVEVVDRKGEQSPKVLVGEENVGRGNVKAWSPDGRWIGYTRVPEKVGENYKICIVSPFRPTRSQVVAEAELNHNDEATLRWQDEHTLGWYCKGKTWITSIENPKPEQFYEDSTNAYAIQNGKYVLFRDYQAGRVGWWIDTAPSSTKSGRGFAKKVLGPVRAAIDPNGQFMLYSSTLGGLVKVTLPDGNEQRLPYRIPKTIFGTPIRFSISQDGKSVVFIEQVSNSKLMLLENPFIKE